MIKKINTEKYWYIIGDKVKPLTNEYYIQSVENVYITRKIIKDYNQDKLYDYIENDYYPIGRMFFHELYEIISTNNPHLLKINRLNKLKRILDDE